MIQEITTTLPPDAVLAAARTFFARRNPIYAAFPDKRGAGYATFRGQGGEEIVIGVMPVEGGTKVRGSTYLFTAQVARFLSTLEPVGEVEESVG
ncbi:MAG TPA: hypothetical protein VF166_04325 [Gemmatimonadaceae bacterium]